MFTEHTRVGHQGGSRDSEVSSQISSPSSSSLSLMLEKINKKINTITGASARKEINKVLREREAQKDAET